MKRTIGFIFFLFAAASFAIAQTAPTQTRTIQQFGALTTYGNDSGFSPENWGVSIRSFTFFDAANPDGFYYTYLSTAIVHSVDRIPFADVRLFGLGWRGDPIAAAGGKSPFDWSLDVGFAPTAELRLKKNEIALDSASLAWGLTLGVYASVGDWGEIGLSWEPVFDPGWLSWGNPAVRNANYSDFAVYWVVKTASESRPLPWKTGARP